jgi:hypothetical protein
MGGFLIFIMLEGSIRFFDIRVRYIVPIALAVAGFLVFNLKRSKLNIDPGNTKIVQGIIGAILLLLTLNPFMWRNIVNVRFVAILTPFFLLLFYRNLRPAALTLISLIIFASGVIYVNSSSIANWYPAPTFPEGSLIVYQNENFYSSQYFKRGVNVSPEPYFLEPVFDKACRICSMGIHPIPFPDFNVVGVVNWSNLNPEFHLPPDFVLTEKIDIGLTKLDKVQFKYLTPIYSSRPALFIFHRSTSNSGAER